MRETWVRSLGWDDSPGEGKGYLLQYSGLENSMDCIVHGVTKSQTRLRDQTISGSCPGSRQEPSVLRHPGGTSLVGWCYDSVLPVQGARVRSLVRELGPHATRKIEDPLCYN